MKGANHGTSLIRANKTLNYIIMPAIIQNNAPAPTVKSACNLTFSNASNLDSDGNANNVISLA